MARADQQHWRNTLVSRSAHATLTSPCSVAGALTSPRKSPGTDSRKAITMNQGVTETETVDDSVGVDANDAQGMSSSRSSHYLVRVRRGLVWSLLAFLALRYAVIGQARLRERRCRRSEAWDLLSFSRLSRSCTPPICSDGAVHCSSCAAASRCRFVLRLSG